MAHVAFVKFTQKDDFKSQAAKKKVIKHIITHYFNEKKAFENFNSVAQYTAELCTTKRNSSISCRRLERNNGCWEMVWNTYSEERFKRAFRISQDTFRFTLSRIGHELEREKINEEPVWPECRLGICLYRLAKGDYEYTIAEMSGLGVSVISGYCLKPLERLRVQADASFQRRL